MSYDVTLIDEETKESVSVVPHTEGGTYALGGIGKAELNITYNYSKHYYSYIDGDKSLRFLNGKKAKDVIQNLQHAIDNLGMTRDDDYWKPTEGNAGFALFILLSWAKQYPEAIFHVSN